MAQQAFAVVHREVERHAAMAAGELHEQAREEVVAGADHPDVQLAARDALELEHRAFGSVELLDDGAADVQQFAPCRRQEDLLAELLEQRVAGVFLELADLRRDGRLGQMQFLGGAREAEQARDCLEDLQLTQRGVLHPWACGPEGVVPVRRSPPAGAPARAPLASCGRAA
jgi:hypothetical protein